MTAALRGRALPGLAARSRPLRLLAWTGLGGILALGQVPFGLWPLALAALAAAIGAADRRSAGFAEGWALGLGHFGVALHWIVEPFLVEPDLFGWMAPFGLALMAGGLALFWGAAFGAARALRGGGLGLVALWSGAEALRSLAFDGFPWALIGHVWIGTPIMQAAALIGPHGLTLGTLLFALWVVRLGAGPRLAASAALGLALWLLLAPGPAGDPDPAAPVLRLVQPNVPQAEKWDPARQQEHLDRLLALSDGEAGAALTVWPETALAQPLDRAGPILAEGARRAWSPVASGVIRSEGGRWFNSLVLTDAAGAPVALYDKAHLTPFGEYIPFQAWLSRWGLRGLADVMGEGFAAGPGPALMDLPGVGPARPLICYEGIFAEEIAAPGGRPRLLLLVTNDAWFGNWAGPRQHLSLARLRAVEQGVPVARAANTGISAMIDAQGRVLASLPLNAAGAIESPLPPVRPPTPYGRWGDWPALLAMGCLLGAAMLRRRGGAGIDPGAARP